MVGNSSLLAPYDAKREFLLPACQFRSLRTLWARPKGGESSSAGESHPDALTDPDVSLLAYLVPIVTEGKRQA
jgi:hypothetical protein